MGTRLGMPIESGLPRPEVAVRTMEQGLAPRLSVDLRLRLLDQRPGNECRMLDCAAQSDDASPLPAMASLGACSPVRTIRKSKQPPVANQQPRAPAEIAALTPGVGGTDQAVRNDVETPPEGASDAGEGVDDAESRIVHTQIYFGCVGRCSSQRHTEIIVRTEKKK